MPKIKGKKKRAFKTALPSHNWEHSPSLRLPLRCLKEISSSHEIRDDNEGNTSLCGEVMNGAIQNEILHDLHDHTYLEDEEFHREEADYLEDDT